MPCKTRIFKSQQPKHLLKTIICRSLKRVANSNIRNNIYILLVVSNFGWLLFQGDWAFKLAQ